MRVIFLFEFKWVVKQWRQLTTPTMPLAQELLMNIRCSGGSRSFAKEMRALEMRALKLRSIVAGHLKLTTTNSEPSLKLILLKHHEMFPRNSLPASLWSFGIWIKLERWKSLVSGCLMNWLKIFKNCHFEVLFFLILHNNKPFLGRIMICDEKCILYDNCWWPAQWLDREEAPKHFPKPNLHPKKVMVPDWCCAADLIHCSFLSPSKTIRLKSMLSNLMRCTENYNACTWYWSKERAQFFSMTMPNCMSHNQHFKSWMSWAASSAIFTWPLANWLLLLQASWQPAAGRKCFPRIRRIPKHRFLHYRNKQT